MVTCRVLLTLISSALRNLTAPRCSQLLARWPGTLSRILSGIQRAAQTVLGIYLKSTCSRVTSASSALGVLNDYAQYKSTHSLTHSHNNLSTHTDTHPFKGPFSGIPRWAGTRKVKPIWILLKQETVSGSGISWAICKSAPRSRQITTPASHHSVFYRPDSLPAAQPTVSKHWRQHNNLST